MAHPSSRPAAITLRLYRALARAFPQEFKSAYGEEPAQVAEDAIEPIWRRHGVPGLVRLLADIAIRVPAEHLAELWQDIRYGLRMLAGSPGFTAVALISLSLGICVATSAFSELNGLAFRNLPEVPNPGELVALEVPASYPKYKRYRELSDLFSSTFAYVAPVPFAVSLGGRTERTWGHLVTPSYFSTLGVRPALGRFFDEQQAPAVVVSYRFWQVHLGAYPSVIGKKLRINGHPCTVIGVGPKDFLGASPMFFVADLWMPLSVGERVAPELAGNALERRDLAMFQVTGRLKPGVTMARAEAQLDAVSRQLEQAWGETEKYRKAGRMRLMLGGRLIPLREQDVPFFTAFIMVLAGLVVLIACANVANMMLARAAERRREIAVRLALGASRARLVRQLLTESVLVAAGAGVIGFILSSWLMHGASMVKMPYPMPISYDLTPDARVLWFTVGLTLFTGLAFGLAPALQTTRTDLTPALKQGGAVRLRRYRRLSLRNLLMVEQVAGSLALLLLTAFLVLGAQARIGVPLGFNPRNLYLLALDPIRDGYSGVQAAAFFQKLLDRVKRIPGITAASLTDTVPAAMNGNAWVPFSSDSRVIRGALKYVVGKDYFETLGIPILAGRGFLKQDEAEEARAVIVSEKLVRDYWKGEGALGRRIEIDVGEVGPPTGITPGTFDYRLGILGKRRQVFEVVGVARTAKMDLLFEGVPPVIYFPLRPADFAQPSFQGVTLMVRAVPGLDAIGAVRREVAAMDPNLTPFNARSMADQVEQFQFLFRMVFSVYGFIGVFGLILAAVGLAGVTAYSVAQRGREIGIRVALGARRSDVLGLVMKDGVVLVAVGTLFGLAGAWAGIRLLAAMESTMARAIEGTSNPALLVGAPLLLAGLALAACYVPARKSLRIDPVVALRQE